MKLDYAVLLAADLEGLRDFYVDILGLPVRLETPSWIELGSGPAILALRARDRPYDGDAGAGAGVQVAFSVPLADLAGHEARLRAQGVEIVEP